MPKTQPVKPTDIQITFKARGASDHLPAARREIKLLTAQFKRRQKRRQTEKNTSRRRPRRRTRHKK